MKSVAIIGTREPDVWQEQCARSLARKLSKDHGVIITTGGAFGIDQAAMTGAVSALLTVYLPWATYNEQLLSQNVGRTVIANPRLHPTWFESVDKYHPNPAALTKGGRALMARNYGIIAERDLVIAFPDRVGGGGTGQGIRIAKDLNIPLLQFNRGAKQPPCETVLANALQYLNLP